ncbi:hypothetical protein [Halomonas sp. PGE1]|uniref:hypothetical protein n=1 Tax=Halomonas sp. PGE1 TaxID=2730360 RepID=UPI001472F74D|nr:hypothetical protein [Halomonas sp. PGE1]QJQ98855.1 hypothetical protein HIR79_09240 [Halomonas sp. PGE1]
MADPRKLKFSTVGLALGALALLVAIAHFWLSAAAPQPAIEDRIADKVVAIRDATVDRLTGREREAPAPQWDSYRLVVTATSILGSLALVLAVVGFVQKEPKRACVGAAALGGAAVAFPFVVGALGAIIILLAVAAFLGMFFG